MVCLVCSPHTSHRDVLPSTVAFTGHQRLPVSPAVVCSLSTRSLAPSRPRHDGVTLGHRVGCHTHTRSCHPGAYDHSPPTDVRSMVRRGVPHSQESDTSSRSCSCCRGEKVGCYSCRQCQPGLENTRWAYRILRNQKRDAFWSNTVADNEHQQAPPSASISSTNFSSTRSR